MHKRPFSLSVLAAFAAAFLVWSAPAFAQDWTTANPQSGVPFVGNGAPLQTMPVQQTVFPDNADMGGYILDTGDKIRVTVFGKDNESLGGDFELDGTGTVRLPLIGNVRAAGLTTRALSDSITQALAAGYLIDPRVSVSVINYRPFYILGEVAKPGAYPYANNMNALNAIALAGGYTSRAMNSTIYVQRRGETIEHEYPADQRTMIYPGDVVRVPDTVFWRIMSFAVPLATFRPY